MFQMLMKMKMKMMMMKGKREKLFPVCEFRV